MPLLCGASGSSRGTRGGMHNEGVSFYVAAGIPEFSAFNSIARRPKSALRSSVKVHFRCAYHPRSISLPLKLELDSLIDQPLCSTCFDNGLTLTIRHPRIISIAVISFFILQDMGQNHFISATRYFIFGSNIFKAQARCTLLCFFFLFVLNQKSSLTGTECPCVSWWISYR